MTSPDDWETIHTYQMLHLFTNYQIIILISLQLFLITNLSGLYSHYRQEKKNKQKIDCKQLCWQYGEQAYQHSTRRSAVSINRRHAVRRHTVIYGREIVGILSTRGAESLPLPTVWGRETENSKWNKLFYVNGIFRSLLQTDRLGWNEVGNHLVLGTGCPGGGGKRGGPPPTTSIWTKNRVGRLKQQ